MNLLPQKIKEIKEWLLKELGSVRTGRASIALFDGVRVESYGSKLPLAQVASVAVEDARTIRITPWDLSLIGHIEKAISSAELGVSTASDERGVRAIFPALTEETREDILKIAKSRLEQAKVSLRGARDDAWHGIQKDEKDGAITEDEKFRRKDEMEKMIKDANDALDEMYFEKEKNIRS